jgi:hypothetical protein
LETYVTDPFDKIEDAKQTQWRKIFEYTDRGGWESRGTNRCDGNADHVITWGGPCAVLRSDNLVDYDIGPAGFREIESTPHAPREEPSTSSRGAK